MVFFKLKILSFLTPLLLTHTPWGSIHHSYLSRRGPPGPSGLPGNEGPPTCSVPRAQQPVP